MNATQTKERERLPPATGTCRWVDRNPLTWNNYLRITIRTKDGKEVAKDYEVEELNGCYLLWFLDDDCFIQRYKVTKFPRGVLACNCPDARNRPERMTSCKHARALMAIEKKEF